MTSGKEHTIMNDIDRYYFESTRNNVTQFVTFLIMILVWGFSIPLAFGVLGGGSEAGLGLTIVSAAIAVGTLATGNTVTTRYRVLNQDTPEKYRSTAHARSEDKQPFALFQALTAATTVAIFVGHGIILL